MSRESKNELLKPSLRPKAELAFYYATYSPQRRRQHFPAEIRSSFCCFRIGILHTMTSSAPSDSSSTVPNARKSLGFMKNAIKYKHNFIQFFAMTGILLLSVRSLGQKYRMHDLEEDTAALKQEHQSLTDRMSNIKRGLLHEASLEPSGRFASRLRLLFGDDS
ncbi:hypothetical protein HRI_003358100 [Hibiscus trionum]|uniref:Uncharacterized protein n=1 Tax=Hibiscus trionum TaxID=183268 RepID=A0A9W7MCW0_HIBTR|nr:hypothetical protein HRI_003358100 [Hibiscus trionum]